MKRVTFYMQAVFSHMPVRFASRIFLLLILLQFSCTISEQRYLAAKANARIALQPLGKVEDELLQFLQRNLDSLHQGKFIVLPARPLPAAAYEKTRGRYKASVLLDVLDEWGEDRFDRVLGITQVDIATRKGENPSWGVMGLAKMGDRPAVISGFRAGRQVRDQAHFYKRMLVLARHELGHTWGLPHCRSARCLMKDAEGKMNLDNADFFCESCRNILERQGRLDGKALTGVD